jgi:hypothetical protein
MALHQPHLTGSGYVEEYHPEHHRANKKGYALAHIVVYEKYYNIKVPEGYVVHHINGIKSDNRPENLLVLGVNEHHKLHSALTKDMMDSVLLARIRKLEREVMILLAGGNPWEQ